MPVVTPRFVDKAWTRGCDFVILDLEDSVPQHLKDHARTLVKDAIGKVEKGGTEPFVRINHDLMEADVEAVVWPGLKRIKYPKTETAAELRKLDALITQYERERGMTPGSVEIDVSIETAVGVANAYALASASPRVKEFGASTGGYDLSRDLGVEMFVDFDQFVYPRGECELAARALGLPVRTAPFVANTTGSVSDGSRALRQAEAARKCGLRLGGGGLNPAVVESHNKGFMPTDEELEDAHRVLELYEQLQGTSDTWREIEGRVIDRYEADRARELIDWAALCKARNEEKAAAVERTRRAES